MKRGRFSQLSNRFVYGLYRAVGACLKRIPLAGTFRLGQALGWLAYGLVGNYRWLAYRNIQIAFPAWSDAEIRRCARRHFQTLGANLLCSVPLSEMPWETARRYLDVSAFERRVQEINGQKALIGVLSHLGNWELMVHGARWVRPGRHGAIYQALKNRRLDAHLRRSRERSGLELIDRSAGLSRSLNLLRAGGMLGILVDQHAGDHGVWTPFFDRLASTTPLPAILAKKTGATLLPMAIYTVGVARWRVEVGPPIEHRDASVEGVTSRINEAVAEQVRRAPQDWFWVHRRWKTPSPHFLLRKYRRGVYVPPRLADKLKAFRLLVRSSNGLEETVMTVPAVRAIKAGRPDAHLTILSPGKLADFWRSVPEVDEVLTVSAGENVWRVAGKLREKRFEVAVLFPDSPRSGLEVWLAGIPRRVGYGRPWRTWCLNQLIPEKNASGSRRRQPEHYLRMAERIGADLADAGSGIARPEVPESRVKG
jgi:heptosyltransferase-2